MKKSIAIILGLLFVVSLATVVSARTEIVKLCEKDTTTWECQSGVKEYVVNEVGGRKAVKYAKGLVRYKDQGDLFNVYLSTSNIDHDQVYQVALVGQGGTATDDLLASACSNPNQGVIWECGYWGNQGFYNFHIGELGQLRSTRYQMHDVFDVALPPGEYNDVKFLVKQNEAPWSTYLFETKTLNFVIE